MPRTSKAARVEERLADNLTEYQEMLKGAIDRRDWWGCEHLSVKVEVAKTSLYIARTTRGTCPKGIGE